MKENPFDVSFAEFWEYIDRYLQIEILWEQKQKSLKSLPPLTLDVGCGHKPCGDVNCDLYPEPTKHRAFIKMDLKKTPNFVLCDAQYLPFRDEVFTHVYCSHLIEHLDRPFLLLHELVRVSREFVTIRCPHRYARSAKGHGHKNFFNVEWFGKALEKIRETTFLFYSLDTHFWGNPLRFLLEITVEIRKTQSV